MEKHSIHNILAPSSLLRRLLLAWLCAVTVSYLVLPPELQSLSSVNGLAQQSLGAVFVMTGIFFAAFSIWGFYHNNTMMERWLMATIFALYAIVSITVNFRWSYLISCCVILLVLIIYALKGWNYSVTYTEKETKTAPVYKIILAILAIAFALFVSIWTVCRVYSFCAPTYDFGIFSQMFYSMKTKGIPYTTVERDMLLSHFRVHVSPIYYLLLPVYFLFPYPATLQVMQALILASSVIPLWLLCRRHKLNTLISVILCSILLVYPAFSAGTSYDIHENAFLAPCILWLLYGLDARSIPVTILFGSLTLTVKEDAAVYVAVIALYVLARVWLRKAEHNRLWTSIMGTALLIGSIAWFLIVTRFLAASGDGVMTYRYQNFMSDASGSLLDVIKSVILSPGKLIYECTDPEKLEFILLTILPLLGLPLITRKFDRYLLLIPFILINLMSDYTYQHDIFFQYTFGSTACLIYLTVVNLADMKHTSKQVLLSCVCLALCSVLFFKNVVPVAMRYPRYIKNNTEHYSNIRQVLAQIPADATVAATTFYTTELSQREILYDVKYTSEENLLSSEYVALAIHSETNYYKYETNGKSGYENLTQLLENNGYTVFAQLDNTLVIYKK